MNALVHTDGVTAADYAALDFLVKRPELRRVKYLAQHLKISEAAASLRVSTLRSRGWVSGGRGCCQPTIAGVAQANLNRAQAFGGPPVVLVDAAEFERATAYTPAQSDLLAIAGEPSSYRPPSALAPDPPQAPQPRQAPTGPTLDGRASEAPGDLYERARFPRLLAAMEPQSSIAHREPPMDRLIDALAGFQDHALQMANAQLRLELTETREERDELRRRLANTLELLAAAADACTPG